MVDRSRRPVARSPARRKAAAGGRRTTAETRLAEPGPMGRRSRNRAQQGFIRLWEMFQSLRSGPGRARGLLSQVDPAVLVLRRQILEDCLKSLLRKSPGLRALSMDQKKMLGRRLSNVAWKGYLLGLAYQDLFHPGAPRDRFTDFQYLSGTFKKLMDGCRDPTECLSGLDGCVARALAEIQNLETTRLEDQLTQSGASQIVGPKGESPLLGAAVSGLALMGFMMWVAHRKALGQPVVLE